MSWVTYENEFSLIQSLLKEAPLLPVPVVSDTLSEIGKNPVKQVMVSRL